MKPIRWSSKGWSGWGGTARLLVLGGLWLSAAAGAYLQAQSSAAAPVTEQFPEMAYNRSLTADPEATCRGLDDGSLIESVVFRRMYKFKNPLEDAIIVTIPLGDKIGGAVVFTKSGQVYARGGGLANVVLSAFVPGDLLKKIPAIESAVRSLYVSTPPPQASAAKAEPQLASAYRLLHDFGDFPSARTKGALTFINPDKSKTVYPAGSVVFDWNASHYFYHPQFGVRGQPIPTDPVTGQPYLCVKHGDLVESVAFYYNYLKTHPGEKAVVLAPDVSPLKKGRPIDWKAIYTWAAAAYTKQGRLYLHSNILGDVPLDKFTVADIRHPAVLHAAFKQMLLDEYAKKMGGSAKNAIAPAVPGAIDVVAVALHANKVVPNHLPGDDDDMQMRRIHLALKNLGGNMQSSWALSATRDGRTISSIRIFCGDRAYEYWSMAPTVNLGYRDGPNPSPLVSSLLFALDYRRTHPAEKAGIVFPLAPDGINTVTLFTQDGATYYHQETIGSFPLPSIKPEDWNDPAKQAQILNAAQAIFEPEHQKEWDKRQDLSAAEMTLEDGEAQKWEAAQVYSVFKDAGIPCQLVNERDRGEDGHFQEFAVPTLVFAWDGVTYTYNSDHECERAEGYFPPRVRIR